MQVLARNDERKFVDKMATNNAVHRVERSISPAVNVESCTTYGVQHAKIFSHN